MRSVEATKGRTARRRRAAALLAAAGAIIGVLGATAAHAGLYRVTDLPVVPENNRAFIYDAFGHEPGFQRGEASLANIRHLLEQEHYHVEMFKGATATIPNFVKMAGAGVVVFNMHGADPRSKERRQSGCPFEKGLVHIVEKLDPQAGEYANEFQTCPYQPMLIPEIFPTEISWINAYVRYRREGFAANQIAPVASEDAAGRTVYGIAILPALIRKDFGAKPSGLIFASACFSISLASDFNAASYFGYRATTYDCETGTDGNTLFSRLTGHEGTGVRDTRLAFNAGGFPDSNFKAAIRDPIMLSPDVTSVDPDVASGSLALKAGSTTPLIVKFGAKMKTDSASGVVSVTGCGATLSGASWADDGTLTASIVIPPTQQSGEMTLTVNHASALGAGSSDPNNELDGNQSPSPANGFEPNGTDYTWQLSCVQSVYNVHIHYSGTFSDFFNGNGATFTESANFDQSENVALDFRALTIAASAPSAAVTGSVSGTNFSCSIAPASSSTPFLNVTGVKQTVEGTITNDFDLVAGFPSVSFSGSNGCDSLLGEIKPFDFYNPPQGGNYDPGGALSSAEYNDSGEIDIASLPYTKTYPFNYTEMGNDGSTDAVSGSATLTVTLVP
jgi:hypothetical protein